ncbi:hypothetical protein Micbo1qcDRAFT_206463 [Microdochium bolleyi]|uniref:Zn(2)-C6 fungal-type domain-containing protein n=1 Tax=Microdochium bolleyi TaxID=196109 RepID=A0A136IXC5_9PEZI|nr:hypothetical protein Micbo1qcDRAFT_206463 [Microdochium bolleyi]
MVGVPGRSKACVTCRRRRKGCDGRRPECTQCITAGLACAGYARQTIFVNWTEGATPATYSRRDQPSDSRTGGLGPEDPENSCQNGSRVWPRRHQQGQAMQPLSHGLARTACIDQFNGLFWHEYLPHGRTASTLANQHCGSEGFLLVAETMYAAHPAVEKVLVGLSMATVGRRTGDAALVQAGIRAYSGTARTLAGMIGSGSAATASDVALILVKGLNTFEIMFGEDHADAVAQGRKLISHMDGEAALLESRGPASLQSGAAHEMLVVGRQYLIVNQFKTRKRSFLHSPEWQTVPWQLIPKNSRDRVVDITLDLVGLFEDVDLLDAAARRGDPSHRSLRLDLVDTCWQLDERLQRWHAEDAPVLDFFDRSGKLRDHWTADDYVQADLIFTYWTACLLLYEIMAPLLDTPTPFDDDEAAPQAPALPTRCDPVLYLRRLGRTLPILLQPSAGLIAIARGSYHLGVALYVLYTHPYTDRLELMDLYARLLTPSGDGAPSLAPFVKSLMAELVPGARAV